MHHVALKAVDAPLSKTLAVSRRRRTHHVSKPTLATEDLVQEVMCRLDIKLAP